MSQVRVLSPLTAALRRRNALSPGRFLFSEVAARGVRYCAAGAGADRAADRLGAYGVAVRCGIGLMVSVDSPVWSDHESRGRDMPVGGSGNTFVQLLDAEGRGRGRQRSRLFAALAAAAVVVATSCATALGAASPSGLAPDATSGRTTVAGALHALTATGASASVAQ